MMRHMQRESTVVQLSRWVALGAIFLIPFLPLVVTSSYFFPFITGKAFFFRILVEIAFFAWILLALADTRYRPRISIVGIVAIAFVVWMFIADALAPNAAKAFWSNFERMEGWVLLIHLLGFFFVSSAVLRVHKLWRGWFYTNIGVALLIFGYAFLQLAGVFAIHQGSTRIDASFGNSAYLAIYLLFTTFIAIWLASTETRRWASRSLIVIAAVAGVLVFFTHTRGAVLGLVGALGLAALLTLISAGKRARAWAGWGLALLILCATTLYIARDATFVEHNRTLNRITSISIADGSTRFTLWGMALDGAKERPLTGWGQEGFNYVFNKHYEPSLYEQEAWFDRAHNTFIDWLSAGGIPAFLLYVALFGSAIVLLWRSPELSRGERIALTAALAGYACHNFFVFDNLYSYIYFFSILALIDSQVGRTVPRLEQARVGTPQEIITYGLPLVLIIGSITLYTVNVSGMNTSTRLIEALSVNTHGLENSIGIFEKFAENPPFAAQEVREQLITFAIGAAQSPVVSMEDKQRIASLAVNEMQKQVAAYPKDARLRLQLANIYRAVYGASSSALDEINKAIELSPRKPSIWIEAGASEWDMGNADAAYARFKHAYELAPQFKDLATYAAAGAIASGKKGEGMAILREAHGTDTVDSDILVAAYYRIGAWTDLISLLESRVAKEGAPADAWLSLAAAEYSSGNGGKAIATIRKAITLYPHIKEAGEAAILEIEAGPQGK